MAKEETMRQSKKNQRIGGAFKRLMAIAFVIMVVVCTKPHLRGIVKETSLQRQIAELVVPAGLEINRPLGEGEYLVPVTYAALPSKADLEREYGKGNVSNLFDGRPFQQHASCEGIE